MVDLERLRKLAEAATPGPWSVFNYDCGDCDWYDHNGPCPSIQAPADEDCAIVHWDGFKQQYWSSANGDQRKIEANAAFIAAANPQTVIAMCNDILAYRAALYQRDAEIERLREALREIGRQKLYSEMDDDTRRYADYLASHESCVSVARAALIREQEE